MQHNDIKQTDVMISDIGFLRHSVRGGIIIYKNGKRISPPSMSDYDSRTRNYANPSIVAPQQSYSPLHVTIRSKIKQVFEYNSDYVSRKEKSIGMKHQIFN